MRPLRSSSTVRTRLGVGVKEEDAGHAGGDECARARGNAQGGSGDWLGWICIYAYYWMWGFI